MKNSMTISLLEDNSYAMNNPFFTIACTVSDQTATIKFSYDVNNAVSMLATNADSLAGLNHVSLISLATGVLDSAQTAEHESFADCFADSRDNTFSVSY
jgi:hypothetical protein